MARYKLSACAFPYVIAFTNDTMEIRLIINGNLVHTIAMPNLNLITSKQDIFFATTAPEFLPGKCERIRLDSKPTDKEEPVSSPPPFPQSSTSRSNQQSTCRLLRTDRHFLLIRPILIAFIYLFIYLLVYLFIYTTYVLGKIRLTLCEQFAKSKSLENPNSKFATGYICVIVV